MVLLSSPSQPAPTSSTVTRRRSKRRIKSHEPSIRGRDQLDDELRQMLDPVSSRLNNDIIGTTEAAEAFTAVFREHLIHNGLLKDEANGSHRDRQIVRMKNTLAQAKNRLRQNFHRLPGKFLNAVRTHNLAVRCQREFQHQQATRRQEKAFCSNPWKFAKSACTTSSQLEPTFSLADASQYFSQSFSDDGSAYASLPSWVYDYSPSPIVHHEFDLSPITPGIVKRTLKKCKSNSTPGPDGITYHHLKMFSSSHHFLATLFTKIISTTQESPPTWCSGKIILIHKEGDVSSPANFRPIVLSSTTGKLLHKILALRLEKYCLSNDVIDPTLQKGFLSGVNGTMEHIFAVSALISHARSNGLPVSMTFLDLRNAFGSISHKLVMDILAHLMIPTCVQRYIADAYAHLQAYVHTNEGSSQPFPITRGVFQGDTMSPIIFLMAFNPVIKLAQCLQCPGFTFRIPVPDSEDLPTTGSTIYTMWDEPSSDESPGWYRCIVSEYSEDGKVELSYPNGNTESVMLSQTRWTFARRSAKKFRSLDDHPPNFIPVSHKRSRLPKYRHSSEHRVKAFADDLTIINIDQQVHKQALSEIDKKCADLDLHIRPDKCITFSFNGSKEDKAFTVSLQEGATRNISKDGAKFLGKILMGTPSSSCTKSSITLLTRFRCSLQALDARPIRGEYKLWIYQHYLAPSMHFHLAVNSTTSSSVHKMEALATKALKKWLKLPRNATQAILYHPDVLNVPSCDSLKTKAKLSFLVAIDHSTDHLIQELKPLLSVPVIQNGLDITPQCNSILVSAKKSVTSLPRIKKHCNDQLRILSSQRWDDHLNELQVQKKFSDIVTLE